MNADPQILHPAAAKSNSGHLPASLSLTVLLKSSYNQVVGKEKGWKSLACQSLPLQVKFHFQIPPHFFRVQKSILSLVVKSLQWSHWGIIWSHGLLQDLPFCWNILLYVSLHLLNPIPSLFLLPILLLWTLSCMIRTHANLSKKFLQHFDSLAINHLLTIT